MTTKELQQRVQSASLTEKGVEVTMCGRRYLLTEDRAREAFMRIYARENEGVHDLCQYGMSMTYHKALLLLYAFCNEDNMIKTINQN